MAPPRGLAWELLDTSYNPPTTRPSIDDEPSPSAPSTTPLSSLDSTDPRDVQPGGRYRPITKLYINFYPSSPVWTIATGFLLTPSVIVTSASALFQTSPLLPASQVKAYVGYAGRESVAERSVQFRPGKKVIIPEGWAKSHGQTRGDDIAFLLLERPFVGLVPVTTGTDDQAESSAGKVDVEVLGYASDRAQEGSEEFGGVVWKAEAGAVHLPKKRIWEYTRLDDGGGLIGSPVFSQPSNHAIAVHTGSKFAVPLGTLGHASEAFISALDTGIPFDQLIAFPLDEPQDSTPIKKSGIERKYPEPNALGWDRGITQLWVVHMGFIVAGIGAAFALDVVGR